MIALKLKESWGANNLDYLRKMIEVFYCAFRANKIRIIFRHDLEATIMKLILAHLTRYRFKLLNFWYKYILTEALRAIVQSCNLRGWFNFFLSLFFFLHKRFQPIFLVVIKQFDLFVHKFYQLTQKMISGYCHVFGWKKALLHQISQRFQIVNLVEWVITVASLYHHQEEFQ